MKLTRKQAFELSIKKWKALAKRKEIPIEIVSMKITSNCGLCEKYLNRKMIDKGTNDACKKCPINIIPFDKKEIIGCLRVGHPFYSYEYLSRDSVDDVKNAKAVLDLIKSKQ